MSQAKKNTIGTTIFWERVFRNKQQFEGGQADLFAPDDFQDVNSFDKGIVEKIRLIDALEIEEQEAIFRIVDGLTTKKKLKDTLTSALNNA